MGEKPYLLRSSSIQCTRSGSSQGYSGCMYEFGYGHRLFFFLVSSAIKPGEVNASAFEGCYVVLHFVRRGKGISLGILSSF